MTTLTLKKATTYFLDAKGSIRSEKTVTSYSQVLIPFSEFAKGEWPVSPDTINAYLAAAKKRGCKPNTVWDYYRTLKIFFNWLQQRGLVEQNPVLLAERPTKERLIPRAPKELTLQKLFDRLYLIVDNGRGHWADTRDLAMFSLAFDTGLRVGELVGLTPADIDLERRTAFLEGHKTYTNRIVVFHEVTANILALWLAVREILPLPQEIKKLFVSDHRGGWVAITDWGVRQALRRHCDSLGISINGPHTLRHAYAVYALRNRATLLDVQKQLGHLHISTTSRYTLVDDEDRGKRHDEHSPMAGLLGGAR